MDSDFVFFSWICRDSWAGWEREGVRDREGSHSPVCKGSMKDFVSIMVLLSSSHRSVAMFNSCLSSFSLFLISSSSSSPWSEVLLSFHISPSSSLAVSSLLYPVPSNELDRRALDPPSGPSYLRSHRNRKIYQISDCCCVTLKSAEIEIAYRNSTRTLRQGLLSLLT